MQEYTVSVIDCESLGTVKLIAIHDGGDGLHAMELPYDDARALLEQLRVVLGEEV